MLSPTFVRLDVQGKSKASDVGRLVRRNTYDVRVLRTGRPS